ncbi:MAG: cellulase family glycosylhydrolase, partial [Bacteroidetes bacterium]|nr:cellulase family glycosylhydrolase [Bacteroidota bacterium]
MKQKLVSLLIALLATVGMAFAQAVGPVSCYGKLMVNASTGKIYGEITGPSNPVQVKGVSFGWNMYPESAPYFTANMVGAMVNSMKAEIVRAPMSTKSDQWNNAYDKDPTGLTNRSNVVIDAAIANGVYVIIDWHSHQAETEKTNAIKYFGDMAKKYGDKPHVIFEIYNEPLAQDWNTIRAYAVDVIAEIRKYSNNLILVGTQGYSQMIGAPADNKINDPNVAYVLHFYAHSHDMNTWTAYGSSQFNTQITKALNAKLPIFVSEWGTTHSDGGQQSAGNFNTHNAGKSDTWMKWCDDNQISWCAWEISNKASAKSAWFGSSNKSPSSTTIARSDLNESGQYIWDRLQDWSTKAKWRQTGGCNACVEVNVTFNYNYTGAPAATVSKNCQGSPAVKPANPTRTGYKFLGWSLNAAAGSAIYPFTANLTGAITLYAQWEQGAGPTLVFDGEKGNATYLCTTWFGFDDGKGSKITTAKDADGNLPVATTGGANVGTKPNGGHIALTYNTVAASVADSWGLGFGFNLSKETTATVDVAVDVTGLSSITFYYKGPAASMQLKVKGVNVNFQAPITASPTAWVRQEIVIGDFAIPSWATVAAHGIAAGTKITALPTYLTNMCAIQFQVNTSTAAVNNGSIAVDHIELQGVDLKLCEDAPELTPYDKLQILIVQAETLQKNTEVGTNPCQAPQSAKTDFATAISTAKGVASTATTTQIENAKTALENAINTFKSEIIPCSNNTLIADCEEENVTKLKTYWSSYAAGAGATIVPLSTETSPFTMTPNDQTTGKNKTANMAKVTGKLGVTGDPDYSSAGIGFPLDPADKAAVVGGVLTGAVPLDLTGATGIGFYHKGGGVYFQVMTTDIKPNGGFDYMTITEIPASATWQYVVVNFPGKTSEVAGDREYTLAQDTWVVGGVNEKPFSPSLVYKLQWQVKGGTTGRTYDFAIDEVSILGKVLDIQTVDTKALDDLIASATTLHGNATEGTAEGNYAVGSKATLLTAINAAKAVSDAKKDQATVNAAVVTLQAAVDAFNAAKIGNNESTLIADCEDKNVTKLQTYWSSYAAGKGSTIVPLSSATAEFTMTAGGAAGTANAASVTGKLDCPAQVCPKGTEYEYASAGISFPFKEPGDANLPYDLTGATGIGFWHKGDAVFCQVMTANITPEGGFDYEAAIPASTTWQYVIVNFPGETSTKPANVTVTPVAKSLAQTCSWSPTEYGKPFLPAQVYKLQWQVKDGVARNYSFAIDEVSVLGLKLPETVSTAKLDALILTATALHTDAVNNPGKYTGSTTTLLNAINAAKTASTEKKDQATVNTAEGTLQAAVDAFEATKVDAGNTIVADCEDGARTKFGTYWYAYDDKSDKGLSTTIPKNGDDFVMTAGGADGTGNYARLDYTHNVGANENEPFVGMGFAFTESKEFYTTPDGKTMANADGVTFYYKSSAPLRFKVPMGGAGDSKDFLGWDCYGLPLPATGDVWTKKTIKWSQLTLEWTTPTPATPKFDPALAIEFQWQIKGAKTANGSAADKGWVGVDQVQIDGLHIQFVPPGLVFNINDNYDGAIPGTYQAKAVPATLSGQALKVGDRITITLKGTADYDINGLQASIQDAAYDGKTDYVKFSGAGVVDGNIKAGVPFEITAKLTVEKDAPGGSYSLVMDGVSTAAKAKGEKLIVLKLQGTAFDSYTVVYEATQVGKYILEYYDADENRGAFARFPAGTDPLKPGDKVKITMIGNSESQMSAYTFQVQVMDLSANAGPGGYWLELSDPDDPWQYPQTIYAGTPFNIVIELPIVNAQVGTDNKSQMILLQNLDGQNKGNTTVLNLPTFTVEVIRGVVIDKTALQDAIKEAELLAASKPCGEGGDYTAGAIKDLNDAITTAKLSLTATVQTEIDGAASKLQTAINTFKTTKITKPDKTALNTAITTAKGRLVGAVEGTADGQYAAGSIKKLEDAIAVAEGVYNDGCVLSVTNATSTLTTAISDFDNAKNTLDKKPLQDAIAAATPKAADANSCAATPTAGDYPATAVADMKKALADAQGVLSTATTQAQITAAVTALNNAVSIFEATKIAKPDKTALNTAITTAKGRLVGAVEGTADGQYAAGSIK